MVDLKKKLIEQVDDLLRKGELPASQHRTLITKIELADPRFLEMAVGKFQAIRKSTAEEDEKVKKADGIAPMTTSTSGAPSTSGAAPAAPAPAAPAKAAAAPAGGASAGNVLTSKDIGGIGATGTPQTAGVGG